MREEIVEPTSLSHEDRVLAKITSKYLLVINIPLYKENNGLLFADELWGKDLVAHSAYLKNFSVCCPVVEVKELDTKRKLAMRVLADLNITALPFAESKTKAILLLPRTIVYLWRAIRSSDVIHTVVAGWPIPYGWLVMPIAAALKRPYFVVVESAPWRINGGTQVTIKSKINCWIFETMARVCLSRAHMGFYTQEAYRKSFPVRNPGAGHVIHASWVDENLILSDAEAILDWDRKFRD